MDQLAIMTQPAAPHAVFGWFDLAWPNIAFWVAVIAVFIVFSWARIPLAMEADAEARRERGNR